MGSRETGKKEGLTRMKFTFSISATRPGHIEINVFGKTWLIDESSRFVSLDYNPVGRRVVLSWNILETTQLENGDQNSTVVHVTYNDVYYFEVGPRDPATPTEYDEHTLSASFMSPDDDLFIYRWCDSSSSIAPIDLNDSKELHHVWLFRGGTVIRIGACEATFSCDIVG